MHRDAHLTLRTFPVYAGGFIHMSLVGSDRVLTSQIFGANWWSESLHFVVIFHAANHFQSTL